MKITFLGTGPAQPTERNNTSIFWTNNAQQRLMVDCGGNPSRTLLEAGSDPSQVTDLILTHPHVDHIYGLPALIQEKWLYKGFSSGKELRIWGLESTLEVAQQVVQAFELEEKQNAVQLHWNLLEDKYCGEISIPGWNLQYFQVTHGSTQGIGIEALTNVEKRVVYTSDCIVDDRLHSIVNRKKTDLLIQDCGGGLKGSPVHAGAEQIASMLIQSSVQDLALVHLQEGLTVQDKTDIRCLLAPLVDGRVLIPDDGRELEVA